METLYLRFISNEKAIPSAFRITALIYRDNLYVFLVVVCASALPAWPQCSNGVVGSL